MKEISIEEKAKRYDNLLVKLQEAKVDNKVCDERYCCVIDDIVPELKESEDKRIKKQIIYAIKELHVCDETKRKCIAWLEQQGEQKPAKNIVETWKDMRLEVYQQASGNRHEPNCSDDTTKMFSLNDIDEIVEKMSEQSSTNKVEPKFKVGDKVKSIIDGFECTIESIDNICYYGDTTNFDIQDQDGWELVEQKSAAWSEEDEEVHRKCICAMRASACGFPEEEKFVEQVNNWLNSLKVREVDLEDSIKESLAQKYIDYTFKRHNIDPESKEGQLIYHAYMHGMNQCLTQLKAQKGE